MSRARDCIDEARPLDPGPARRLYHGRASGRMAEWLCRGLQILVQRFDSASGLQPLPYDLANQGDSAQLSPPRPRTTTKVGKIRPCSVPEFRLPPTLFAILLAFPVGPRFM